MRNWFDTDNRYDRGTGSTMTKAAASGYGIVSNIAAARMASYVHSLITQPIESGRHVDAQSEYVNKETGTARVSQQTGKEIRAQFRAHRPEHTTEGSKKRVEIYASKPFVPGRLCVAGRDK
jgi:hypothetical protein